MWPWILDFGASCGVLLVDEPFVLHHVHFRAIRWSELSQRKSISQAGADEMGVSKPANNGN